MDLFGPWLINKITTASSSLRASISSKDKKAKKRQEQAADDKDDTPYGAFIALIYVTILGLAIALSFISLNRG